ncbi:uncharacterized protein LOC111411277 [Olea europaea var. sylvestris]|uniref:uncharacterized protein LOC111411277 n=1 Tax=Olea europaea var. sylvestris TaxID=158386 RepID=UPI000C1D4019|nr:uncharacterized protein LOC111411277 [Olea europaea var. sylvestris]
MAVALIGRAPSSLPSNTKINSKKHAKTITTRSGMQLPEIHVKRLGVNRETRSLAVEETMEHNEQIKESTPTEGSEVSHKHPICRNSSLVPSYAKFLKDILSNTPKLGKHETIMLTEESRAKIQNKLSPKLKDPGSLTVLCTSGEETQIRKGQGIIIDALIKVEKFIFLNDFFILDMEEDNDIPLILDRPFLATGRALIDVHERHMILRLGEE